MASPSDNAATGWVATTRTSQWQTRNQLTVSPAADSKWDVEALVDKPLQTIDGFGACFSELGWTSLSALDEGDREAILEELFAPGIGANFSICRMPIGANDFSVDWYSYDEVPADFGLEHFSISHDLETLVPFIRSALKYQPKLKLWASPWSPPTWMKYNKHYAAKVSEPEMPSNGLRPDQSGKEGSDMFIQEDRYFRLMLLTLRGSLRVTEVKASTLEWSCLRMSLIPLSRFRAAAGPPKDSQDSFLSLGPRWRS